MGNNQLSLAYQNAAVGRRAEPYRNQVIDETFGKRLIWYTFIITYTCGFLID
jgi:hypothetical protein